MMVLIRDAVDCRLVLHVLLGLARCNACLLPAVCAVSVSMLLRELTVPWLLLLLQVMW
jgi:hypothetical protein